MGRLRFSVSVMVMVMVMVATVLTVLPGTATGALAAAPVPVRTVPIGKQLAELKGANIETAYFGDAVAISGNTVLVGSNAYGRLPFQIYVFSHGASGWAQGKGLNASGFVRGDVTDDVAVSGRTAVESASIGRGIGVVCIFKRTTGGWVQSAELTAPDGDKEGNFGGLLAMSASTIVVGDNSQFLDAGRAYVITRSGGEWRVSAELKASDAEAGDFFGSAVAISGGTIVVGAPSADSRAGRAYVFKRTTAGWDETAELKGSDSVGSPSPSLGDQFGSSLDISGSTIVVGAYDHANLTGAAYVFSESVKSWHQSAELKGLDSVSGDAFGAAVVISGTTIVAGAYNHNNYAGAAYVFAQRASGWRQVAELKGSDTKANDDFGSTLAISGTTLAVGVPEHAHGLGRVYLFQV